MDVGRLEFVSMPMLPVILVMIVGMVMVIVPLDLHLTTAATTCGTHHSTSNC
jgi:hypothetical protein